MTTENSAADREAAAAVAAAKRWITALASPPPGPPSSSSSSSGLLLRRLGISRIVHEAWTSPSNGGEAGAAERWFDGSVDALEDFVSTAAEQREDDVINFVEVVRDGAQLNVPSGVSALFAASKMLPGPSQRPALLVGAADGWRCTRLWRRRRREKEKGRDSPPCWRGFASSFPAGEKGRLADGRHREGGSDVRREVEVAEAVALIETYFNENGDGDGDGNDGDGDDNDRCPPLPYLKDLQCSQAHPQGFLDDARPFWASGDEWLGDGADSWKEKEEEKKKNKKKNVNDDDGDDDDDDDDGGDDDQIFNSSARKRPPSYRFVYAGPRGASTPWHCDVYGSCAWSANVAGWKRWTFLTPENAPLLYSRFGEETAKWFDGGFEDEVAFPWLKEARVRSFSVLQGPGDIVFVPPAWWHCVENVAPPTPPADGEEEEQEEQQKKDLGSISINVNFLSGPVACAAAWEDSVLREHEEALRKAMMATAAASRDEGGDEKKDGDEGDGREKVVNSSPPLPPLPPLPARQVDGTTLSSTSTGNCSFSNESAQGIGIGGFVALALGAAERAAKTVAEASESEKENDDDDGEEEDDTALLLSRVALARAAVSARSARSVLCGAASYARRAAAAAAASAAAATACQDEGRLCSRFLEGIAILEVERAAERARETVEAAAKLLGVVPQF